MASSNEPSPALQPVLQQRRRANSVQQSLSEQNKKSRPAYLRSNSSNTPSDFNKNVSPAIHFTPSLPLSVPPRPMRNPARVNTLDHPVPSSPPRVLQTGPREEITPWEMYPPPPLEDERRALASPPSKSRLISAGASQTLSALVRRRKSAGTKIFKPRPIVTQSQVASPPSLATLPIKISTSVPRAHESPSSPISSPEVQKAPLPFPEPPTAVPQPSPKPQPPSAQTKPAFSTADRRILEELKRNIQARESHFVLKGHGNHRQRHHPYPKEVVPYPRSYERIALDLDVWETLWCRQLCESLTWHVFERPPTKVLDIGCGTGTWILECARQWRACHFVGLDIVPLQPDLTQVGSSELASRVTWLHSNFLETLPFQDGEFDFVHIKRIALGVPEDKWDRLFEEITRVLKPGGAFELLEEDLFFPGEDSEEEEEIESEADDDSSFQSVLKSSNSHPELPSSAGSSSFSLAMKVATPPRTTSPLPIPGHELGEVTEDEEDDAEALDRLEIIANAIPQQFQPPNLCLDATPRPEPVIPTQIRAALIPSHSSPPSAQPHYFTTDQDTLKPSSKHRLPPRPATSPPRSGSVLSQSPPTSKPNEATLAMLASSGGAAIAFGGMAAISSEPLPALSTGPRPLVKSSSSSLAHPATSHDKLPSISVARTDSKIPPISVSAPTQDDVKSAPLPRHVEKPVSNPRDHSLLRFIYKEMNAARFVNLAPLSLLSNCLGLHFKDVRTHPPLQCTFPPRSLTAPPTHQTLMPEDEDEDDARDAIIPTRRERGLSQPASSSGPASPEISEDGRWVFAKGIAHGRSPYVTIDESRAFAFSPAPVTPKTTTGGAGAGTATRPTSMQAMNKSAIQLPNPKLNFDLQTLNLHLALRTAEILTSAEAMWEYVLSLQQEHKKRGKTRPGSALLDARKGPRGGRTKREEQKNALLELTRYDFGVLVRNFELDMRDSIMLGSALHDRFGWACPMFTSPADREAFDAAIRRWEEYDARKHAASRHSHESESQSHGASGSSRHSHSNSTPLAAATLGDALSSRTSASSKKQRKRREHDHLRRSRAMKVFVAWKASS